MRYLPLTLGLILTGCTPQPRTVQHKTAVVDIESVKEKNPLLIIPEPIYEEHEKKTSSLDKLVKDFVEESIKHDVTTIEFNNFSGHNLLFERNDNEFEFKVYLWGLISNTLQIYGDNGNVGSLMVTYTENKGGITANGSYLVVSSPTKIVPEGPLKKPLTDLMEIITTETKNHRLMEGIYSSEKVIYTDEINSPKFAQACANISEYILSNK